MKIKKIAHFIAIKINRSNYSEVSLSYFPLFIYLLCFFFD